MVNGIAPLKQSLQILFMQCFLVSSVITPKHFASSFSATLFLVVTALTMLTRKTSTEVWCVLDTPFTLHVATLLTVIAHRNAKLIVKTGRSYPAACRMLFRWNVDYWKFEKG